MALIGTVAGFATFGVAARGLALTMQRRALSSGKARRSNPTLCLGLQTTRDRMQLLELLHGQTQSMDGCLTE